VTGHPKLIPAHSGRVRWKVRAGPPRVCGHEQPAGVFVGSPVTPLPYRTPENCISVSRCHEEYRAWVGAGRGAKARGVGGTLTAVTVGPEVATDSTVGPCRSVGTGNG
jgi:hypothetical protein